MLLERRLDAVMWRAEQEDKNAGVIGTQNRRAQEGTPT